MLIDQGLDESKVGATVLLGFAHGVNVCSPEGCCGFFPLSLRLRQQRNKDNMSIWQQITLSVDVDTERYAHRSQSGAKLHRQVPEPVQQSVYHGRVKIARSIEVMCTAHVAQLSHGLWNASISDLQAASERALTHCSFSTARVMRAGALTWGLGQKGRCQSPI